MRKMAKSFHVVLICTVLFIGHLHTNNLIPSEETEEIELQMYELFESHESESEAVSEETTTLLVAAVVVIAVPVAPLAGVLYVWASSLASTEEQPQSGTSNIFVAYDSAASASNATDDTLISVRWDYAEDDLNWAFVTMRLIVGNNTYYCSTSGDQDCLINQDGSDHALWETSEFLTLSESGIDIANDFTYIGLWITYRGTQIDGDDYVAVS